MAITPQELRAVALLASIEDKELTKLARQLKERTYEAGQTIVKEGTGGIGFFLMVEGTATVSIRGEQRGTLKPGATFGELALFDMSADRMATIVAETDVRCAGMTAWEFKPFVVAHPEVAWAMLTSIAARLRAAEERAEALVHQS
jgi:CRP/FNR family transcriptional regulator, cyclic AMP receptor protein